MAVRYRAPAGGINLGGRYFGPNVFVPAALAEPVGLQGEVFGSTATGQLTAREGFITATGTVSRTPTSEIRRERVYWGEDDEGNEIWTTATIVAPIGASSEAIAAALRAEIQAWLESHGGVT